MIRTAVRAVVYTALASAFFGYGYVVALIAGAL